jgi:hypothetical protein
VFGKQTPMPVFGSFSKEKVGLAKYGLIKI